MVAAVAAAAAAVAAVGVVAAGAVIAGSGAPGRPHPTSSLSKAKKEVLYRLASASVAVPSLQGRYVELAETDTETGYPGQLRRTTVVDTLTGASTTYQQAYSMSGTPVPNASYQAATATMITLATDGSSAAASSGTSSAAASRTSVAPTSAAAAAAQSHKRLSQAASATAGPPRELTEGATSMSTEGWYAALPTDPVELKEKLLLLATQPVDGRQPALTPSFTDDDYVYQQADTMLWSPLVGPTLRAALYKVLASTTGYTVATGTDPAGRPAIVMTRVYTGTDETDVTYESPSTGAVLAQVWKVGSDVIRAVYQPIVGTTSVPPDPYPSPR